jgi:hypothetical protein
MSEAASQAADSPSAEKISQGITYLEMMWGNGKKYLLGRDPGRGWRVRDEDRPEFLVTGLDLTEVGERLDDAEGADQAGACS